MKTISSTHYPGATEKTLIQRLNSRIIAKIFAIKGNYITVEPEGEGKKKLVVTMQSRILWLLLFAGVLIVGAIIAVALMHDESASGGDIHKFESTEALKAYLKAHRGESVPGYSSQGGPAMMVTDIKELQASGGGGQAAPFQCPPFQRKITQPQISR